METLKAVESYWGEANEGGRRKYYRRLCDFNGGPAGTANIFWSGPAGDRQLLGKRFFV
ncbi:hypothetical protein P4V54_05820 [Brevibacillus nitrificans]|nr:hypothetical protein [Brevibacillus nitrificans]